MTRKVNKRKKRKIRKSEQERKGKTQRKTYERWLATTCIRNGKGKKSSTRLMERLQEEEKENEKKRAKARRAEAVRGISPSLIESVEGVNEWQRIQALQSLHPFFGCRCLNPTWSIRRGPGQPGVTFHFGEKQGMLYGLVHKRHHEHHKPRLETNFHFTVPDLILEGFVPMFVGILFLEAISIPSSQLDQLQDEGSTLIFSLLLTKI